MKAELSMNAALRFTTVACYKCAVIFAMPTNLHEQRLRDRESFYCPHGHGQAFAGKTPEQKLKEELDTAKAALENVKKREEWALQEKKRANEEAEEARRQRDVARASGGKLRKRIKNGLCPCCKRSFTNLRRHVATKHPEFSGEAET